MIDFTLLMQILKVLNKYESNFHHIPISACSILNA